MFVIIHNFSNYLLCIPLKNKNSQTVADAFSSILTTSKQRPLKLESDRGSEWYKSIFQNLLKSKNKHHHSRFTDKGPWIAERVLRTIRNLLKKPVFEKKKSQLVKWIPSVMKQYKNTIHSWMKMTPFQASKKSNKKEVYWNPKVNREIQKPNYKLGQLVRTADIKRFFSRGDSTNRSYKLYTITEIIHDTIPSYRIDYLP